MMGLSLFFYDARFTKTITLWVLPLLTVFGLIPYGKLGDEVFSRRRFHIHLSGAEVAKAKEYITPAK